jgi:hypothetical protein
MPTLVRLASLEAALLLAALIAIVSYQMLTGRISLAGLLRDKTNQNQLSPVRVQLFVSTVFGAGALLYSAATRGALTVLPPEVLVLFASSQGLYLAGKYLSRRDLRL